MNLADLSMHRYDSIKKKHETQNTYIIVYKIKEKLTYEKIWL